LIHVLVATRNEGKLRELRTLLSGEPLRLESLAAHVRVGEVDETGETFEENAKLKAAHAARKTGLWTIGEDSGIEVDALGGAPGIRSARYAGVHGDDAANNRKLIEALKGVDDRTARYVCALALASPTGEVVSMVRGASEGRIVEEPRGTGGFGYDPYFVPEGETRTNAELTELEKSALSHRGRAVRALIPILRLHVGLPSVEPGG
jgi:XTP/dITP diphosphohydrolase